MKRSCQLLAAATLTLAACSSEDVENNIAASEATDTGNNMMDVANDPSNPYGRAEMQMHERMTAAAGANAAETWVRKMIEHHRGGAEISDILLAQGGDRRFLDKARMSADQQRRDIAELERMLEGGIAGEGPANPYAQVEGRMHDQMIAARGSNAAETWARKMIAHHQGALDMTEALLAQGGDPEVLAMARRTADMQRREIAELENLLAGGSGSQAAQPSASGTRESAAPEKAARPAEPRRTTPARPAPKEEPIDPHAGHDMNNMSH